MRAAALLFVAACQSPPPLAPPMFEADAAEPQDAAHADATHLADAADLPEADAAGLPDAEPPPPESLSIRFLGVGGFSIASGADRIVTPPLYSNPALDEVLTGTIRSDPSAIDRFVDPADLADTKAYLVGHAHYDHLMDLPYLHPRTPEAMIYGNADTARLLGAFAPDHAPGCPTSTAVLPIVPRDRVVAVNDPSHDRVDYRMCAEPEGRCTGSWDGSAGEWIEVPSSRVRVRALCSAHPDQFLFFHLGEGCVDEEPCAPPPRASDWREGSTIAWLVDFLDASGAPAFRVYYQDAPTDGPVGYVHPDLLAEKEIDVAILCVGNYDQVTDQPQSTIAALAPRFVIAGHWESFFRAPDQPLANIPFLDVDEYVRRMNEALGEPGRGFKLDPGMSLVVSR